MFQLCFYVPETHLETVKQALFAQGAGALDGYDQCCWQVQGEGQFRPLPGSRPFLGESLRLEQVVEYKVETICRDEVVKAVLAALLAAHPYEMPAYRIYKIQTLDDL